MAEFRCPTRLANTIDGSVAGVIFDIGHEDPGALLSEQLADGFADAVGATRNDGGLIFQPVHVRSRMLRQCSSYRVHTGRRRSGRLLGESKDLVRSLDDIAGQLVDIFFPNLANGPSYGQGRHALAGLVVDRSGNATY